MDSKIESLNEDINDNTDIVIEYLKMILCRMDEIINCLKMFSIVAGIKQSEKQIKEGKSVSADKALAKLQKKYGF